MSSRVTFAQIVDNITQLSAAVKPAEFIYDFLTCFGAPKATIARLKGGSLTTPFSPPSGLTQWLFQGPPAESEFLAACPRKASGKTLSATL
jgi:hypothetical protein